MSTYQKKDTEAFEGRGSKIMPFWDHNTAPLFHKNQSKTTIYWHYWQQVLWITKNDTISLFFYFLHTMHNQKTLKLRKIHFGKKKKSLYYKRKKSNVPILVLTLKMIRVEIFDSGSPNFFTINKRFYLTIMKV